MTPDGKFTPAEARYLAAFHARSQTESKGGTHMVGKPLTQEQAIEHYTELQRRISVGAYLELEHDGSYPPDDGTPESTTLESIDNVERWAARQGLEFSWHGESKAWSLEPIEQRSGECVECGRHSSQLSPQGSCEGCVMQAALDAMTPEERWK